MGHELQTTTINASTATIVLQNEVMPWISPPPHLIFRCRLYWAPLTHSFARSVSYSYNPLNHFLSPISRQTGMPTSFEGQSTIICEDQLSMLMMSSDFDDDTIDKVTRQAESCC